jgi:DNA-binding protein HU-beta
LGEIYRQLLVNPQAICFKPFINQLVTPIKFKLSYLQKRIFLSYFGIIHPQNVNHMRKSDLINQISDKTGIPKVDVLVTLETMFKEVKESLSNGQNIYIRGFGSFITKKRAAKIGRNIKKNIAVEIPEHFIPAFKPAKEFVAEVKTKRKSG